jgi:hypothetical protein
MSLCFILNTSLRDKVSIFYYCVISSYFATRIKTHLLDTDLKHGFKHPNVLLPKGQFFMCFHPFLGNLYTRKCKMDYFMN